MFKTKVFLVIIFLVSIGMFGFALNLHLNKSIPDDAVYISSYESKPSYPNLTSSVPKEQMDLNADLLISMLPAEAKNCKILTSMHQEIKDTISQNQNDPAFQENLKINNDLFNVMSYKLNLRCSTFK